MMTVTVETRGDGGRDHRFAERHGLAMVSVAIMFEAILVTFAATGVTDHFKVAVAGSFNLVRGMTIRAHRAPFVAFGKQLAMDAFCVDLFDPDMALAAGFGDVLLVDG